MSKGYMYAHIPGTGPAGATCDGCRHLARESWAAGGRPKNWCGKAAEQAGARKGRPIPRATPACKYWEARPCA